MTERLGAYEHEIRHTQSVGDYMRFFVIDLHEFYDSRLWSRLRGLPDRLIHHTTVSGQSMVDSALQRFPGEDSSQPLCMR